MRYLHFIPAAAFLALAPIFSLRPLGGKMTISKSMGVIFIVGAGLGRPLVDKRVCLMLFVWRPTEARPY